MNEKPWKYANANDGERRRVEIKWPSRKPRIRTWDSGIVDVDAQLTGKATLVDADGNREPASQVEEDGRIGYKSAETGKLFWEYDPDEETGL